MYPTYNPQNSSGTGIPLDPVNPQPSSSVQLQPATGIGQPGDYSGSAALGESISAPSWTDPTGRGLSQTQYNNLVSGYNDQKANIYSSSKDAASNFGVGLGSSISDLVDSLYNSQQKINEEGVQNNLSKIQGFHSILDMVGRGIRSGGILLAGKNATSGSAAEALARAYGDIGNRQQAQVGNQYEIANRNIGLEQDALGRSTAAGVRKINDSQEQGINNIVADAQNKLAALDAAMAGASLTDRLNIEQEKNNIKQIVTQQLGAYSPMLSQGVAGITPTSDESRRTTAQGLSQAGTAPASPFDFSTQTPAQFQDTGPFASDIPVFTAPRKKTT